MRQRRRNQWYERPGDDAINPRTGKNYPQNHAVPRIAWHAQHAHTATEAQVYEFLERRGKALANGRKVMTASRARIARELKMPESTVRNCLRSLCAKHSLVQWDADRGRPLPRQRGDFGGTTTWLVPTWPESLDMRRADEKIGKVAGPSGKLHCYVIGKGKRFLSPYEIQAWKVDAIVAERYSRPESPPSNESETVPPPGTVAEMASGGGPSPPGASEPARTLDLSALQAAIIAACGECSREDAGKIWRAICRESGSRTPSPNPDDACEMVAEAGAKWRKVAGGKSITPGLLLQKVKSQVTPWMQQQAFRRNQERKKAAHDRDARINGLAQFLQRLAQPVWEQYANDDTREYAESVVAAADPNELATARRIAGERGGRAAIA